MRNIKHKVLFSGLKVKVGAMFLAIHIPQ
jgi:hypothetical protein